MSDWVKRLKEMVEAVANTQTDEGAAEALRVFIPTPDNSPLANLMDLPEHEVSEWMARQQYKRMH